MKLNEIFTEWKTGGGIFSLMVKPPWEDSITGLELDIEYFTNQSGTKQPSLLLLNFIEDNKISQNDVLTISNLLLNRFGRNWTKLWNTLLLEYNPINNYDMEETENLVIDEVINNSGESSNTSEIDSNRYAFDSETPTPTEGQRQTGSNEFSDNGTRNNTHVRELTRKGNIGVTTSQQMITAERDLWVWDFFKTVFKDVDSVLTVPIFSLDYCKKVYEYTNGSGSGSDTEKYVLPVATASSLGGIKADPKTDDDILSVRIGSDYKLYVQKSGMVLEKATENNLGGIKAKPKTSEQTNEIGIDENGFLFASGGGSSSGSNILVIDAYRLSNTLSKEFGDSIFDAILANKSICVAQTEQRGELFIKLNFIMISTSCRGLLTDGVFSSKKFSLGMVNELFIEGSSDIIITTSYIFDETENLWKMEEQ